MKSLKNILFLSSLFCLLFYGCCKDEEPCKSVSEVKANFKAKTVSNYADWMYPYLKEKDWYYQNASFGAQFVLDSTIQWDSLEWHIGNEVIYNQPTVYRGEFPDNQKISITLIVKRKPNLQCHPNDNGIDTLTKNYVFLRQDQDYKKRFLGRYKGVFIDYPALKDSFEFEIMDSVSTGTYTMDQKRGIVSIKRFPLTICDFSIRMGILNPYEMFIGNIARDDCWEDGKPKITNIYFSFIDENINQIELVINPRSDKNNYEFPKATLKGYKL